MCTKAILIAFVRVSLREKWIYRNKSKSKDESRNKYVS